jgi:toxin ParE1/3/4
MASKRFSHRQYYTCTTKGEVVRYDLPRPETLLDAPECCCQSLAELPVRGHIPKEVLELGSSAYRELHHRPYRIIHRVMESQVIVACICDGRLGMQSLLLRRLMR